MDWKNNIEWVGRRSVSVSFVIRGGGTHFIQRGFNFTGLTGAGDHQQGR
jgi:hypothetical protein